MKRSLAWIVVVLTGVVVPALAEIPIFEAGIGEVDAIRGRNLLYHQRHGSDGQLTAEEMLERSSWGYRHWLEHEAKSTHEPGWVNIGPVNGAGRCIAVAPHPSQEGTLYVGAAGGGLWRTVDGGASWVPLTDGISDLSVGAVALAPSALEVIYLGTGEGGIAGDFIPGIGLLRSDDGGTSWFLPGSDDEVVASQFFALSVSPSQPDEVLAGTNEGLLLSTDGGGSFQVVIASEELVGVTEVIRSSQNPDLLYAGLWCSGACPDGVDRVMRSTDGGLLWSEAGSGLPPPDFNQPLANRLAIAVAPTDDKVLYVATYSEVDEWLVTIYRSNDGGESWFVTGDPGGYLGPQGWYDNTITVHPEDPETVVAGGVWYVSSTDGGATWRTVNPYDNDGNGLGSETVPHVDAQDLQWQGSTLWLANDGGIWSSDDAGLSWQAHNQGLVTRQYYGMALDPSRPERVLAGTQDNATNLRRDAGDDTWDVVIHSDGFDCAINPYMPDYMFGTIFLTHVYRSTDAGGSWTDVSPTDGAGLKPFYTPMTMREDEPWVLYTGTSELLRTTNSGSSWQVVSSFTENGPWSSDVLTSIAVTPADRDLLMVGKGNRIYVSADQGAVWRTTLVGATVNNLAISGLDPLRAVACLTRTTDGSAQLLRTNDGGESWLPSGDGLPPFAVHVARWDEQDSNVVWAGTDVGLYQSTDGGVSWAVAGQGLPAVSVHDVRLRSGSGRPVVATHGRGVWELVLEEVENTPPTVSIENPSSGMTPVLGDSQIFEASVIDADGDELQVTWLFSDQWQLVDGGSGAGLLSSSVSHTFDRGGTFMASVHAEDAHGAVATASVELMPFEPADSCATARIIPGAGPFPVTILTENFSATEEETDPEVPCSSYNADPTSGRWGSLWFELTPELSGRYLISTCGSWADTVLSAWTGPSCGPFELLPGACNDDDDFVHCTAERTDSFLELDLEAGTTYRFMVGSWGPSIQGPLRFNVECHDCEAVSPDRLFVLPVAAHSAGDNNTTWVTDMTLFNPGDTAVTAQVALRPLQDPSAIEPAELVIQPGRAVEARDVVAGLLATSGAGAVHIEANGDLVVSSRTFNDAEGGTYGQGIPGVAGGDAVAPGGAARLIGMESSAAFRTNLGLTNTGDSVVPLSIELYNDNGNLEATLEEELGPFEWKQLNRIFEGEGLEGLGPAFMVVRNLGTGPGSIVAYGSVVDEATGDPAYLAPTTVLTAEGEMWIPAASHAPGVGDSLWRTDLSLSNIGAQSLMVTVEFYTVDGDEPVATFTDGVAEGTVRFFGDVVGEFLEQSGTGALRITIDRAQLVATSRTYNQSSTGTFGQSIPGIADEAVIDSEHTGLLLQLRSDEDFRSNVGLVNLTGQPLQVSARYFAGDGEFLGARLYAVRPHGHFQANGAIPGDDVSGAFALLTSDDANARFLGYASVVDNGSGDPIYVPAVVFGD